MRKMIKSSWLFLVVPFFLIMISTLSLSSCGGGGGGITADNTAPIANAGPDQNVLTGVTVTLDGSMSTDANGDLLTYNWSFTSRPANSTAALSSTNTVNPTFTADKEGTYVLSLMVNDGQVNSAADTVTITAATANSAPVANAGPDQSVSTTSLVTLDGSGSSDANGDLLTYNWSFTSRPANSTAALSNATVVNPTFTADKDGSYVLSLVVNDGQVNSAADVVTITTAKWTGTKQLGVAGKSIYAYGVAVDGGGNVFVAGNTQGGLDGNTLTGGQDFFVTKYDSSGNKVSTKQLGVAGAGTEANGVAVDTSGNVYVAGSTNGGLDGNTLTGVIDFFVTKYDSSGNKVSTKQLGVSEKQTRALGVDVDASGNVYVAGYTEGGLDGNTLTGTQDFFVTKYDSSGNKVSTKQLGVAGKLTIAFGVKVDGSGNVYVAGTTQGGLDGNALTGTGDFFVTKYDSSGNKVSTKQLGVAGVVTIAYGVVVDGNGNVFVAGITEGGLDGNTLTGATDFFVTKYDSAGSRYPRAYARGTF